MVLQTQQAHEVCPSWGLQTPGPGQQRVAWLSPCTELRAWPRALPAKAAAEKFQLRKKNTQRSTAGTHALRSAPACAQPPTKRGSGKGDCGTRRRLVPQLLLADTRENNIYFNVICFLRDSLGRVSRTSRRAREGSGVGQLLSHSSGRGSARCPHRARGTEGRKAEPAAGRRDSSERASLSPAGRPSDSPRGGAGVLSPVSAPGPAHRPAGCAGPQSTPTRRRDPEAHAAARGPAWASPARTQRREAASRSPGSPASRAGRSGGIRRGPGGGSPARSAPDTHRERRELLRGRGRQQPGQQGQPAELGEQHGDARLGAQRAQRSHPALRAPGPPAALRTRRPSASCAPSPAAVK